MALKRIYLVAKGRVQGVCFRAYTESRARELGLGGWVRNLADHGVEILAEGEESDLLAFIELVKKGPPAAIVKELLQDWREPTGEFSEFNVVYWGRDYY